MSMPLLSSAAAAALVGNSNDLVCEILSRLPLDSVVRFRLVCKAWRSLASTQFFNDKHKNINRRHSCFVVQYFDYSSSSDYFSNFNTSKSDHFNTLFFNLEFDHNNNIFMNIKSVREPINLSSNFSLLGGGRGEEEEKIYYQQQRTTTKKFSEKTYYHIELISSCGGFLLYTAKPAAADMSMSAKLRRWLTKDEEEKDPALILYNPLTKEKHTVTAPSSTHVYCGFYYHSPTKEHRILYQLMFDPHHHDQYEAEVVQFLVFGLQTKSTRVLKLKVNNYNITLGYNSRDTTYYNHIDTSTPPVISNGSLHWFVSEDNLRRVKNPSCSRSILSFGMESEEFRTMPHPPLSHTCQSIEGALFRHEMNLLEMDGGILCLCDGYGDGYSKKPILEIYVMEDYKKWSWIRRYRIDLSGYIHSACQYGLYYKALQILRGDRLLLYYHPHKSEMNNNPELESFFCDAYHEYALYSLNGDNDGLKYLLQYLSSISSTTGMVMVRQPFQVIFEGYPYERKVIKRLIRMIIKPTTDKKKKRSPSVGGNIVLLIPNLTSLQHNGSAPPGIRTFFSIRTNRSYEYM